MTRARYIAVALACVCVASASASGAFASSSTARANAAGFAVPALATSAGLDGATWAVVPMGKTSGSYNVFWQLFTRTGDTAPWHLVTPPGVADNGGLIIGSAIGQVLVAFGASRDLLYSPLALSRDGGSTWVPGGLPVAIDRAPAALAIGAKGQAVAIVGNKSQNVLVRSGDLTQWKTLASATAIAKVASYCRIGRLSAVALATDGEAVLGTSCGHAGVVGLFVLEPRVVPLDVAVPAKLAGARFEVLDIRVIGSAVSALVEALGPGGAQLFVTSSRNSWRLSAALDLAPGASVSSIGWGADDSYFIEYARDARLYAAVGSITTVWRVSSALPIGTATVALSTTAGLQALAVSGEKLTVFDQSGSEWRVAQRLVVPIAYGSSS